MKFYRMDSDQYKWRVWKIIREEVGQKEFAYAKMLYHDFYSLIADAFDPANPEAPIEISLRELAESTFSTVRKVERYLDVLSRSFLFEVKTFPAAEGKVFPSRRTIFYPNFLKKQERSCRVAKRREAPCKRPPTTLDQDLRVTEVTRNYVLHRDPAIHRPVDSDPVPPPDDHDLRQNGATHVSRKLSSGPGDVRVAEWMLGAIRDRNPAAAKLHLATIESWANDVRLLREEIGASHQLIADVVGWALKDGHWRQHVQSPSGVRRLWLPIFHDYRKFEITRANH